MVKKVEYDKETGEYYYLEDDVQEEEIQLRDIRVIFVKEYKFFINKYQKKTKEDYILNVNKIIRDKIDEAIVVPNKMQAFMLNYHIKKLLDKAINIKNNKYKQIIYLNNELTITSILNSIQFLDSKYDYVNFNYSLIDLREDFDEIDRNKLPNVQFL